MGLELDLGLAIGDSFIQRSDLFEGGDGFDCSKEAYGSSLSSDDDDEDYGQTRKSARFVEAGEADSCATRLHRTLPLLIWNGQNNGYDDHDEYDDDADSYQEIRRTHPFPIFINARAGYSPVGWPPIKPHMKRLYGQNHNAAPLDNRAAAAADSGVIGGGRWDFRYVKVQMEGVVITRKVNLSFLYQHQSYDALTRTLVNLFGKDDANAYTLTYQDKEGDWMVAGDLPWRAFIWSIQRLKLLKENQTTW